MESLLSVLKDTTKTLYADPHNPHLHLQRGRIHKDLGFPDLASADAYRALSLLDSVVDPDGCEFFARRRIRGPSTENGVSEERGEDDEDYGDNDDEDFTSITEEEYNAMIGGVYALLVQSLVSCGCYRDGFEFAVRGCEVLRNLSIDEDAATAAVKGLEKQIDIVKKFYISRRGGKVPNDDIKIDPSALPAQGYARRILYPWNEHEPDRKSPDTLNLLNERLKDVAPKCEVRAVALPALHHSTSGQKTQNKQEEEVSIQLGLFAKEDVSPGEIILREASLLTATNRLHDDLCDACNGPLPSLAAHDPPVPCEEGCEDVFFCSWDCQDAAQRTYHGAVCGGIMERLESIGKDVPDPKDKADYLYFLLLGRAIAMAATQEVHPLELPEVKYIWGDFHDFDYTRSLSSSSSSSDGDGKKNTGHEEKEQATLPFSFHLSILQPMRLIEEMELDPYASLPSYDTWVLNTLYAKFRGTASGRLSTWDGGPELCAVHPLWCLANHSCDPNVRWEWGGEITFRVREQDEKAVWKRRGEDGVQQRDPGTAGIKKDEEIRNHYCDVGLGVKERREWASGALGGKCLCERCVWEAGEV